LAAYQPSSHGGGWTYGYKYQLWSQPASNIVPSELSCASGAPPATYEWFKTYLTTPDGTNHLLVLESSTNADGTTGPTFTTSGTNAPQEYYGVDFSGNLNHFCATGSSRFQGTLNYITIDGSYIRVQANTVEWTWQAYFPDGSSTNGWVVAEGIGSATTSDAFMIADRNGNQLDMWGYCVVGEACTETLNTSYGGSVTISYEGVAGGSWVDTLTWPSANQLVTTTVNWETYDFNPNLPYPCRNALWFIYQLVNCSFPQSTPVVASVQLPAGVTGGISDIYFFGYDVGSAAYNWGQIHYLTMCTGTSVTNCQPQYSTQYAYYFDSSPAQSFGNVINPLSSRTLHYTEVGDVTGTDALTETTSFNIPVANQPLAGGTSIVTHPDGSATTYYSANLCSAAMPVVELCAPLVYKVVAPDGTTTEIAWATDSSPPSNFPSGAFLNPYPQYTAIEVPTSANGKVVGRVVTAESTAIDGNGNVTSRGEYGFLAPGQNLGYSSNNVSSVSVLSTVPGTPLRTTSSGYCEQNPYWAFGGAAAFLRSPLFSTKRDSNGNPLAASQYVYDNCGSTGNLTTLYQWDSTLGPYPGDPPAFSLAPTLSSANAAVSAWTYVSLHNGNVASARDPSGHLTTVNYDNVYDLYPLSVVVADGLSESRTTSYVWQSYSANGSSIFSGYLQSQTDQDNNVTSTYTYDWLGRPTSVQQSISGTPYRSTVTAYNDSNLEVTIKQDRIAYQDWALVTTTYYDPLGRPRLTIDPAGNKIEKAYRYGTNVSYELTSNPYNPNLLTDPTMGWSLTTRDSMGRVINVSDYAGSIAPGTSGNLSQQGNLAGQTAPASWGSNTTTTGTTSAAYNLQWPGCSGAAASYTDEANNTRDYCPDGLGRLAGVTEPNGNLTAYGYDMLEQPHQREHGKPHVPLQLPRTPNVRLQPGERVRRLPHIFHCGPDRRRGLVHLRPRRQPRVPLRCARNRGLHGL
jgi:hypothetical protein